MSRVLGPLTNAPEHGFNAPERGFNAPAPYPLTNAPEHGFNVPERGFTLAKRKALPSGSKTERERYRPYRNSKLKWYTHNSKLPRVTPN